MEHTDANIGQIKHAIQQCAQEQFFEESTAYIPVIVGGRVVGHSDIEITEAQVVLDFVAQCLGIKGVSETFCDLEEAYKEG